jgi:polysaccharide pyruvyl transferase WcaK-like protein
LHSAILGLVTGKKVLPIAYNKKIKNILGDINYDQTIIELGQISNYKETGFVSVLKDIKQFDVSAYTNSDDLQFEKLDRFLK